MATKAPRDFVPFQGRQLISLKDDGFVRLEQEKLEKVFLLPLDVYNQVNIKFSYNRKKAKLSISSVLLKKNGKTIRDLGPLK